MRTDEAGGVADAACGFGVLAFRRWFVPRTNRRWQGLAFNTKWAGSSREHPGIALATAPFYPENSMAFGVTLGADRPVAPGSQRRHIQVRRIYQTTRSDEVWGPGSSMPQIPRGDPLGSAPALVKFHRTDGSARVVAPPSPDWPLIRPPIWGMPEYP